MQARSVAIRHGVQWISSGWQIFKRSPLPWIGLTASVVLIWYVLLSIPTVGPLLFNLLFPVFFAGLMIGCRDVMQGRRLHFGYLFAGFRENAAALVTVGGIYLVGMLIVLAIAFGNSETFPKLSEKPTPEEIEAARAAIRQMTGPLLTALVVYIPLMMLTWFAPLLIVFGKMAAWPALKQSFSACMQNIGPFMVYGMLLVVLWIAAALPFMLGLVIVLPVIFGSIYASYVDLFERPDEASTTRNEA
jgi:hypothetical protein